MNEPTSPEQGDCTSLPASASVLHNLQTLVVCQRLCLVSSKKKEKKEKIFFVVEKLLHKGFSASLKHCASCLSSCTGY